MWGSKMTDPSVLELLGSVLGGDLFSDSIESWLDGDALPSTQARLALFISVKTFF